MALSWLTVAGGAFLVWLVLVFLFTPGINYHLSRRTSVNDRSFLYTIQSTCQAQLHHGNRVTIFTDGPAFYPAILDAIRGAQRTINMECYIFQHGKIGSEYIEALTERAMRDPAVAARLLQDYERDLANCREVTLDLWQRRPVWERLVGPFVWILERQQ